MGGSSGEALFSAAAGLVDCGDCPAIEAVIVIAATINVA
jgi:hypothetical protein